MAGPADALARVRQCSTAQRHARAATVCDPARFRAVAIGLLDEWLDMVVADEAGDAVFVLIVVIVVIVVIVGDSTLAVMLTA